MCETRTGRSERVYRSCHYYYHSNGKHLGSNAWTCQLDLPETGIDNYSSSNAGRFGHHVLRMPSA